MVKILNGPKPEAATARATTPRPVWRRKLAASGVHRRVSACRLDPDADKIREETALGL